MFQMFTIIGVLLVLFGLSFVGITIILLLRKVWRISKSTKTTGVVMNVEVSQGARQFDASSTRNTLYKSTVRFQTADGRVVDYTPQTSNSWSNYRVGENVPVYYNPQQPEKPIVGRPYNLWFPFFLFGFVGGIFVCVGAIFMLSNIKIL